MPENDDHLLVLRRQALRALQAAYPAPVSDEELDDLVPLPEYTEARRELHEELRKLLAWGLVENLRHDALRTPWWRITGEGVRQITREAERLDPRVWGRLAVG